MINRKQDFSNLPAECLRGFELSLRAAEKDRIKRGRFLPTLEKIDTKMCFQQINTSEEEKQEEE